MTRQGLDYDDFHGRTTVLVGEAHQEKTQRSDAAGIEAKGNDADKNGKLGMFAAASARVE